MRQETINNNSNKSDKDSHEDTNLNIFTRVRSFIINKITRSFIIVEFYCGRLKGQN